REGKSVAIVDWDVHHGNGTQDIFWDEAAIGYVSLHQFPLYPGSGAATESGTAGNILNLPVAAGSGDDIYFGLFDESVLPFLRDRAPDVVLISAGFDAHERDPLAQMNLTTECFAEMTRKLLGFPVLSVLEGGYDLQGLSTSVRAHLEALLEA
ncbi:MAG: histone deacetylase, partial [Planctomycetota bacterium]